VQLVLSFFLAFYTGQAAAPEVTGGIAGRVLADGTNAPIAGAQVIVVPAGPRTGGVAFIPPAHVTTDQDGRFALSKLAPGEYTFMVHKTGFAPLNDPMERLRTFTIVAGQALNVEVSLQRGGVIAGRVLDPNGEPLSDARVMAMRRMPAPPNRGDASRLVPAPMQGLQQTNDLGEFRLAGLAPGEYIIAALRHGFSPFGGPGVTPHSSASAAGTTTVTTFYPGTTDQAGAQTVTVSAGAEVVNIAFIMQTAPAFRVSGIVVDESGVPVDDAIVTLLGDPRSEFMPGSVGSGRSDAGGQFVIHDVPAGTYLASASVMMSMGRSGSGGINTVSGGFMSLSYRVPGSGSTGQSPEIVVTDADVSGVRVVTQRPKPE